MKRWRGIVKARHVVLAIYDYYLQKQEERELAFEVDGRQLEKHRSVGDDDAWTLEYIDLMHVQPIIEALDLDTSGYVTIQEVNQFTTSRPKGWRYVATIFLPGNCLTLALQYFTLDGLLGSRYVHEHSF